MAGSLQDRELQGGHKHEVPYERARGSAPVEWQKGYDVSGRLPGTGHRRRLAAFPVQPRQRRSRYRVQRFPRGRRPLAQTQGC